MTLAALLKLRLSLPSDQGHFHSLGLMLVQHEARFEKYSTIQTVFRSPATTKKIRRCAYVVGLLSRLFSQRQVHVGKFFRELEESGVWKPTDYHHLAAAYKLIGKYCQREYKKRDFRSSVFMPRGTTRH